MRPSITSEDKYLTPYEVAELCEVHYRTVYAWIRQGKLPAKQLSRKSPWYVAYADIPTFLRKGGDKSL